MGPDTPDSRARGAHPAASAAGPGRPSTLDLGRRVRQLRRDRAWTLDQASGRCGLSRAALSKIERDRMSPTFGALQKIAQGFGLDLSELIASRPGGGASGRRSVTRAGGGEPYVTGNYEHRLLACDLSHKAFLPFRTVIKARSLDDFEDWDRHDSEDFIYVLEGAVTIYTELYEPIELQAGDSIYLDCRMGHACVTSSPQDAVMLWISAP
jgi:transcriptional regulator with XRE-family HTH domain